MYMYMYMYMNMNMYMCCKVLYCLFARVVAGILGLEFVSSRKPYYYANWHGDIDGPLTPALVQWLFAAVSLTASFW